MSVPVVPLQAPEQHQIHLPSIANPWNSIWWTTQSVSGVPEQVMGWLVAQGWEISGVQQDTSTTPPTMYYALTKQGLQPWQVLLSLCNAYTIAANEARSANELRYNDVLKNWTNMINSTHQHFSAQTAAHNSAVGVYIADLNRYVSEINTLLDSNRDSLALDYASHASTARGLLNDLGATELARINEAFQASLSTQLQELVDRGLYSSAVAIDIRARNTRDRDEQIQALKDRLARERVENEHRLYQEQTSLAEFRRQAILDKMNMYVAKLEGWKAMAADDMRLMMYQLDERNKLLIGLYSFVERREDVAPQWKDMATMIAGLGDAAGGWIQP